MNTNRLPIASVPLTKEQKADIEGRLTAARAIVERVSSIRYGDLRIREFRRDYAAHALDGLLSPADHAVMRRVIEIQDLVIGGFVNMVGKIVNKSIRLGAKGEFDDLVQEGLEVIILSMVGYDGSYDLSTYLWTVVNRHFFDLCRNHQRRHQMEVNMPETMDIEEESPQNGVEDSEYDIEIVQQAMQCVRLTPLEKEVLKLVMEGRRDAHKAAAATVINPATGRPFSRMSANTAHRTAREKVIAVYNTLLARARSRRQNVA